MATTNTIAGVTVGEMVMTNGAAWMGAMQVLLRYQIQVRRKAKDEGRIMEITIGSLTGGAVERQMKIPPLPLHGTFRAGNRI
jgi:hypothetical protein